MAFDPCPGCGPNSPTTSAPPPSKSSESSQPLEQFDASGADIVSDAQGETAVQPAEGNGDYTITWDMPDTRKERVGLLAAGALAFLAPFVGFAVAAHTARRATGYVRPIGAGAITFFAMRAAAVGVLHVSGNLPNVSTATALGATLPQVPRRNYQLGRAPVGRAPCRGCR